MLDQEAVRPRRTREMGEVKGPIVVNAVLAIALFAVANSYTSSQIAVALAVSSFVSGVLNVVRAHLGEGGVRKALVCIGIGAAILMAPSKLIMKYMPRPVPETIIVGVEQGGVEDHVFGAVTGSTQCNQGELAVVVTPPKDKDYVRAVQCFGKVWEAAATIGRRDKGKFNPGDATATYTLRVFSGSKETVLQAIEGQVIPPGLTKISGGVDKVFTPGPLVVNRFRLIP